MAVSGTICCTSAANSDSSSRRKRRRRTSSSSTVTAAAVTSTMKAYGPLYYSYQHGGRGAIVDFGLWFKLKGECTAEDFNVRR